MYGSKLVQQVINKVMVDGKKSTAEKIVYEALDILARRTSQDPVPALEESIKQITPVLEVRSRRVGGATYQVPVEVPPRRARTLAVRYENAQAQPAAGFYVESLAGVPWCYRRSAGRPATPPSQGDSLP